MLFLALAFGAGWVLARGTLGRPEKEALPPDPAVAGLGASPVTVTVEPVMLRSVQRSVEGVGTLHGFEEITISARVEGRISRLLVDVADRVKPGQLLVEIDPTDYELAVEQAERALQVELAKLGLPEPPGSVVDLGKVPSVMQALARLENAKSRHERMDRLRASNTVSVEEAENAASDFRAAQAEHANQTLLANAGLATIRMKQASLAVAQKQLKDSQVRVPTPTLPVPGAEEGVHYVVTHRAVSEGTLVRPGAEICKLVINQTLKLRAPIPERYGTEVQVGQTAEVHTAAFSRPFTGSVARVNPAVEPTTRTFEVEIQVPNPRSELKPGSFAKAAILTRQDADAVTVPLSALVNFAGINKVFLVEQGRAQEVQVTTGLQTTEWVEITAPPLAPGAQVVTSGQSVLADDTPVRIRDGSGAESSATREETPQESPR